MTPLQILSMMFFLNGHCCQIQSPQGLVAGESFMMEVHQDAKGGRPLRVGAAFVAPRGDWNPQRPAMGPNAVTIYELYVIAPDRIAMTVAHRFTEREWRDARAAQGRYEQLQRGEIPK